jgi:hypothetical protein
VEAFFLGVAAMEIFLRLMLFVRPGFPLQSFEKWIPCAYASGYPFSKGFPL